MLEALNIKNAGPAPQLVIDFAPRLNLITGDNGLGKSFILDVAWWALTGVWANQMVIPQFGERAEIAYKFTKQDGSRTSRYVRNGVYDPNSANWVSPPISTRGLVIYAQDNGGFSVWDPMRTAEDTTFYFSSLLKSRLSSKEVWEGTPHLGLDDDWSRWWSEGGQLFQQALNLSRGGGTTPIHISSGMYRVAALTYVLHRTWYEHVKNADRRGLKPCREITILIDEIERHLHPQWQRTIVPGVLRGLDILTGQHNCRVQVLGTTHSPLVLASLEPLFDTNKDAWFNLCLEERRVSLAKRPYVRQGLIDNYLTEVFGLVEPRSLEGEKAIVEATRLMHAELPSKTEIAAADHSLRVAGLPDIDPFWVRWNYFCERVLKPS
jgi:hypothetical protein